MAKLRATVTRLLEWAVVLPCGVFPLDAFYPVAVKVALRIAGGQGIPRLVEVERERVAGVRGEGVWLRQVETHHPVQEERVVRYSLHLQLSEEGGHLEREKCRQLYVNGAVQTVGDDGHDGSLDLPGPDVGVGDLEEDTIEGRTRYRVEWRRERCDMLVDVDGRGQQDEAEQHGEEVALGGQGAGAASFLGEVGAAFARYGVAGHIARVVRVVRLPRSSFRAAARVLLHREGSPSLADNTARTLGRPQLLARVAGCRHPVPEKWEMDLSGAATVKRRAFSGTRP